MTLLRVVKVKRSREIKTELEYGVAAALYGPIRLATRSRQRDALDKLIATHALAIGVRWSPTTRHISWHALTCRLKAGPGALRQQIAKEWFVSTM
jgi:hypothetical protein